jgi:dienelactone hydrolase
VAGLIFLTDIMGIRDANLGMAKRIAEHGYVVLVPNIFYRVTRLPVRASTTRRKPNGIM